MRSARAAAALRLGGAQTLFLTLLGALGAVSPAGAQGLIFEAPEAYAGFPKLERHRAFLPERVDLSARFPTPGDQGDQGSCVGWAVGYAARSYYAVSREGRPRNQRDAIPSPAYIYGAIKPAGDCDTGALISRALDLLARDGAVSLATHPYSDRICPAPNRAAAAPFRIANWRAINFGVVDDAKGALAKGHPVIIGSRLTAEFKQLRGDVVWNGEGVPAPGAHAMTLVGYDERRQAFKLINSWGTRWGDMGFGWMSYDAYRRFVVQAYVMDVAAAPRPAPFTPIPPQPPAPPKRTSTFEPGIAIAGDLVPGSGSSDEAPNAQVCQARCLDRPQCVAWRWDHENERWHPRTCALIAQVTKRIPDQTATSGVVSITPAPAPAPGPRPAPPPTVTLDPPLASYQCASLDVAQAATGTVVRGFVGTEADLGKLFESAKRVGVRVEVAVRPWPQCETLLTFKEALAEPGAPDLRLRGDKREYKKGEPLVIEVKTPAVPSYLYLVYVQSTGGVVYLVQPRAPAPSPQPPGRTIVLGDGSAGGPKFTIDGPYGDEMVIAIASESPLFDEGRPSPEIERDFLTAFRKALLVRPSSDAAKRKVSAAWIALTTKEK
ncbi:MAG: C1 family peptidase [Alphaproteobacteria bacterium]